MYREFIPAKDLAMQWPVGCWVWDIEKSGGPLYTLAVWSIDLLRWLAGSDIVEVHPTTKYTKLAKYGGTLGYDAAASLRFANGMVGCLQYSGSVTHSASASRLEVIGDSTYMIDASHNDKVTLFGEDPFKSEWDVKQTRCAHVGTPAAGRVLRPVPAGRQAAEHHGARRPQGHGDRRQDRPRDASS